MTCAHYTGRSLRRVHPTQGLLGSLETAPGGSVGGESCEQYANDLNLIGCVRGEDVGSGGRGSGIMAQDLVQPQGVLTHVCIFVW